MKNVATVFSKSTRKLIPFNKIDWPLPEQLIGIEIELETFPGVVHPTNLVPYWTKVRDGSLRNGMEYVLAQPLKGDALSRSIYELFHEAVLTRSTTGSTHVHIDMMEEATTPDTIKVMVLLAFILEPGVFAVADPGREWCGYTNKLSSAPDSLIGAVLSSDDTNNYEQLRLLCNDGYRVGRYYGLNLMALQEHGSIEFRYFPTATSVDEVVEWVSLVQSFKKAALELGTISELMETVSNEERYNSFLSNYFGSWLPVFLDKVPQYAASSALRKAIAVAGAYSYRQQQPYVWDEAAVTGNKLFSKFVKKNRDPAPTNNMHVAAGVVPIPEGDRVIDGDILSYRGMLYFRSANRWHDWREYVGHTRHQIELRRAWRWMHANLGNVAGMLAAAGETRSNTTQFLRVASEFYSTNINQNQERF